jgi:cell division protein FtsW
MSTMMRGFTRRLGRTDWGVLVIVLALVLCGLVMVYSATFHLPMMGWTDVTGPTYYVLRQLRFVALGLIALFICWAIDYRHYKRFAMPILIGTVATLGIMALLGRWVQMVRGGAGGQVVLYGAIQPAEFAKVGAIVYIALWLESKRDQLRSFSMGAWPFTLLLGIMAGLIGLQPDFSTAVLLVATATAMFFVAGADMKHFALLLFAGALLIMIPVMFLGYGSARLEIWLAGPMSDPLDKGYQLIQALQALSSGGFMGVGLGQSGQKMYLSRYTHTDFIYSILAEEFGFVGAVAVIALYGLWLWRGFEVAKRAPDMYGRLLAVGVVCWVVFQATLSIAVATNSTPVTGTVLPFISYGGSSLVTTLASVGILLNTSRAAPEGSVGGAR